MEVGESDSNEPNHDDIVIRTRTSLSPTFIIQMDSEVKNVFIIICSHKTHIHFIRMV